MHHQSAFTLSRRGFLKVMGAGALAALTTSTATSCARVEGTGRRQLMLIPADKGIALGNEAWAEITAQERRSTDPAGQAMMQRIAQRLLPVVPQTSHGFEFELFESDTANAFALPGGKVAVYTGLLKYMENEAELAAVVGHEMGHIVARHGSERMSQRLFTAIIVAGGTAAIGLSDMDDSTKGIAIAALGAGATVGVLLPYSRRHEYEADHLGATYMAKAGYDPRQASGFWRRFSDGKGGGGIRDFMSTHPADSKRIAALDNKMAAYTQLLNSAPNPIGPGAPIPAHFRS